MNVTAKCIPGNCKVDCLLYVRDKKKLPCFMGDADKYARFLAFKGDRNSTNYQTMSKFFSAFDSCDMELMEEQLSGLRSELKSKTQNNCSRMCGNNCDVNSAVLYTDHFLTVLTMMSCWYSLVVHVVWIETLKAVRPLWHFQNSSYITAVSYKIFRSFHNL